jgi:uncharacterized protein (DUF433 family)
MQVKDLGEFSPGRTAAQDFMDGSKLLKRTTVKPSIFGGKPVVLGRLLAVEHILGMLASGDSPETILGGYPWLEPEDIQACLVYARRVINNERIEPLVTKKFSVA